MDHEHVELGLGASGWAQLLEQPGPSLDYIFEFVDVVHRMTRAEAENPQDGVQ